MSIPLPKKPGQNAGAVRGLRLQAKELRKRAEALQAELDLTVDIFGQAFAKHDAKESTADRIARTASRNRRLGVTR